MGTKTFICDLKTSVNVSPDTFRAINLLANRPHPYAEHRSRVLYLKTTKKNTLAYKMNIEMFLSFKAACDYCSWPAHLQNLNLERALRESDSNIEQ